MKYFFSVLIIFILLPLPATAKTPLDPGELYISETPRAAMIRDQSVALEMPGRTRPLSLRVSWPAVTGNAHLPVIIWSHGAFGSKDGYEPLSSFWAGSGYIVIQPTHADSMQEGTLPMIKNPASFKSWDERPGEISFIIDHLDRIAAEIPELSGHIDANNIGVGGHSFGANTAMLVAGMTTRTLFGSGMKRKSFSDPRPKAFVMLSPQGTGRLTDEKSYATITRPALFATGSKDDSGRDGQPFSWRLEAYNNAAPGDKYLLFIDEAYHGFGGISGKMRGPNSGPADPAQVRIVQSTTLAFWDGRLKNSKKALVWLHGEKLESATRGAARISKR